VCVERVEKVDPKVGAAVAQGNHCSDARASILPPSTLPLQRHGDPLTFSARDVTKNSAIFAAK